MQANAVSQVCDPLIASLSTAADVILNLKSHEAVVSQMSEDAAVGVVAQCQASQYISCTALCSFEVAFIQQQCLSKTKSWLAVTKVSS